MNFNKTDFFKEDRQYHEDLKFQIIGKSQKNNIEIIPGYETKTISQIRDKYGVPINWLWAWILKPVYKIFTANGGGIVPNGDEKEIEKVLGYASTMKNGYSLRSYMEKEWLEHYFIDPAGIVLMEHDGETTWPQIYSVTELTRYELSGRMVDTVEFAEIDIKVGKETKKGIRIYTSEGDQMYVRNGSDMVKIDEYTDVKTGEVKKGFYPIPKEWKGQVPAFVISDIPDNNRGANRKKRLSPIDKQLQLGKNYFLLDTIRVFVAIKNGYGTHYWYSRPCKECNGEGFLDDSHQKECNVCKGAGRIYPRNVTDVYLIDWDGDSGEKMPDKPGGIIEGDTKGWAQYLEQLEKTAKQIELSKWGTHRTEVGSNNNTATGAFIDVNTANDIMDNYSRAAEWIESKILFFIAAYMSGDKIKSIKSKYGRRYNVESPDALFEKYQTAVSKGAPEITKTSLLIEYYEAAYKNDPETLTRVKRLLTLEPFVHHSVSVVNGWMNIDNSLKLRKAFIADWAVTVPTTDLNTKTNEALLAELDKYISENNKNFIPEKPETQPFI